MPDAVATEKRLSSGVGESPVTVLESTEVVSALCKRSGEGSSILTCLGVLFLPLYSIFKNVFTV